MMDSSGTSALPDVISSPCENVASARRLGLRRPRVDDSNNNRSPVGFRTLRPIRLRVPTPLRPQAIRDAAGPLKGRIHRPLAAALLRTQRFGWPPVSRAQLLSEGPVTSFTERPKDGGLRLRGSGPLSLRPRRLCTSQAAGGGGSRPLASGPACRRGGNRQPFDEAVAWAPVNR
jgi:hypothetical protein